MCIRDRRYFGDWNGPRTVGLAQGSACEQGHAGREEVTGAHDIDAEGHDLVLRRLVALDAVAVLHRAWSLQPAHGERGRLDAGHSGDRVEDARGLADLKARAVPSAFMPLAQRPVVPRALEVRTSVAPATTMAAVRRAVGDAAPGLPIESMEPMDVRVQRGLGQERLVVLLTSAFGALALGLAGFGLFGIVSYAVARRTPELGLRMALGASRSRVLWSVMREALRLVLFGTLLGIPLVLVGGTLASTLFFGVSPHDPLTLVVATLVLVGVGMSCSAVPARRASRVDPIVALRQE